MDSKGWIPIALIASFNRIKQLTQDVQLVTDVLSLSTLVEVNGSHVRLGKGLWKNFALPNAPQSTVEDTEGEAEEEEEDDVVIVMNNTATEG
jgi:la-related protein 1